MQTKKCKSCGKTIDRRTQSDLCMNCQKILELERLDSQESPFLTVKEMAVMFRTNEENIRYLNRKEPTFPRAFRLRRGRLLFRKDDVEQYIKSKYQLPPSLVRDVEAIKKLHGGVHHAKDAEKDKVGRKEDIPVVVVSKGKGRKKERHEIRTMTSYHSDHVDKG